MGEKAKVKETVRLYTKLWQLPSFAGIVARLAMALLVVSVPIAIIKTFPSLGLETANAFAEYCLLFAIPIGVGVGGLYLTVRQPGSPLDLRRTTGASLVAFAVWLILSAIGVVVDAAAGTQYFESRLVLAGMALSFFALSFLVTGLSTLHPLRHFVGTLFAPALLLLMYVAVTWTYVQQPSATSDIVLVALVVVGAMSVRHIFRSVSMPFERDLGINGPALLRAFGYSYLVDNPRPFEEIMTQIAEQQDVPIEVIVIRDADGLKAIGAILYVHPGPFRNIGSSALPATLIEHLEDKYGVTAFVLHGTCTHHQNLTTKEDYGPVLKELDRLIDEARTTDLASGPHWSNNGRFKAWTLFVDDDVLVITTSAPHYTDDIALEVGKRAAMAVRDRNPGIRNVAIVDAHNSIGHDAVSVMPDDPDAEEYVGTVAGAVFATASAEKGPVSVGVYRTVPEGLGIPDGIGPGGIAVIVIRSSVGETAIVSVDGNNVEPGFREEVISLLRGQGFDQVEITTTDTHIVNAVSLSHSGYPPVGRERREDVLEAIGVAAVKARERVTEAEMGLAFGEVRGIRTFGERGFDTLTQDVAEATEIAKRVGLRTSGLFALFTLLLSLLL